MNKLVCACVALMIPVFFAFAGSAAAQHDFPSRAITMVAQFPAGGGADLLSRVLAQKLTEQLGVPVAVVNKPGANGNIAAEQVAHALPDGYTLLSQTSAIVISPALYEKLAYDVTKDLAPVTLTGVTPMVLIVHPSVPANSIAEFISYAKANAGKLAYASNGLGNVTHLAAVMFTQAIGIDAVHVPYKGAAPSVMAVAGGSVQFAIQTPGAIGAYLKDKRVKALAVTTLQRLGALPDVPTLNETVLPKFEITTWQGMMVPAKTPAVIIAKLNSEIAKALRDDNVRSRFLGVDTLPVGSSPEEFGAYIKTEVERWSKAVKSAGVKPE
jgi:tripartite-type tricarboxylate transporter receptor subunit TctC